MYITCSIVNGKHTCTTSLVDAGQKRFLRIRHPCFIYQFYSNIVPNDVKYLFINSIIWASIADSNRDYLWSQTAKRLMY